MYPRRAAGLLFFIGLIAIHMRGAHFGFAESPSVPKNKKQSSAGSSAKPRLKGGRDSGPSKLEYVDSDAETANACRGFINHDDSNLTVVCSHDFPDASRAKVLLHEPYRIDGVAETFICDFLNTASPMITDCVSTQNVVSALRRGDLIVAIERANGRRAAVPVRIQ